MIIKLKSFLCMIFLFIALIILTLTAYISTFFKNRIYIVKTLTYGFAIIRSIIFKIIGIKIEYRGLENIPNKACIFASKHQSAIETSFFFNLFKINTVYAFKKEINSIPLWGKLSKKFGGIAVDRKKGSEIVNSVVAQAQGYLKENYSIVIFPEGTRVAPFEERKFKKGIAKIYSSTDNPVIPVALNAGVSFPKKSKVIKPAKLIIEFLPAMPEGLSEDEFLNQLQTKVNEASNRLVNEALELQK